MDRLTELREDLWRRWTSCLEPTWSMPERAVGLRTVYSTTPRFDLANWASNTPLPGGPVSETPILGTHYHAYGLDACGRPVSASHGSMWNRVDWQGAYRYHDDTIELIEFCVQSQLPSHYERLTFRDGCRATYQRLHLNSGGHFPRLRALTVDEIAARIRSNSHDRSLHVEAYEIADGRIVGGESLIEGLGMPEGRSPLEFTYGADGLLSTVAHRWEGAGRQWVFARRSDRSRDALSAALSHRIAEAILKTMRAKRFAQPVIAMELSYRRWDQLLPYVVPITSENVMNLSGPTERQEHAFSIDEDEIGPEIVEFAEAIKEEHLSEADARMLRGAARLVTLDASESFPRSAGFVAYAIDDEVEYEEFSEILEECGASHSTLQYWRTRGWLPSEKPGES